MKVYLAIFALLVFAGCKKSSNVPLDNGIFYSGRYSTFNKITFSCAIANGATYSWDFGDGAKSTAQNPIHAYGWADSFTVTVVVNNDAAHKMIKEIYISSTVGEITGRQTSNLGAQYKQYVAWPINHSQISYTQGWPSSVTISAVNDSVISVTDTISSYGEGPAIFRMSRVQSTDTVFTFVGANPSESVA